MNFKVFFKLTGIMLTASAITALGTYGVLYLVEELVRRKRRKDILNLVDKIMETIVVNDAYVFD